jgi:hypothetical protein
MMLMQVVSSLCRRPVMRVYPTGTRQSIDTPSKSARHDKPMQCNIVHEEWMSMSIYMNMDFVRGQVQRREALLVDAVDVCIGIQQFRDVLLDSTLGCNMQCCRTKDIARIDIGSSCPKHMTR